MNIFIIPGNPPALYFYETWKKEILSIYPEAAIHISPYPRFQLKQTSEDYFKKVISAHAEELQSFQKTVQAPVTLIGHSLGGWVALKLLREYESLIHNCILLHPFLRTPTLKGKIILRALHYFHKTSQFEKWVMRVRPICEKIVKDLRHVTDEELRSTLNLAYHEYIMIGKSTKLPTLDPHLRKKIAFIYCAGDTWCDQHTIKEMLPYITHIKTKANHGFIVSKHERACVFDSIQKLDINFGSTLYSGNADKVEIRGENTPRM